MGKKKCKKSSRPKPDICYGEPTVELEGFKPEYEDECYDPVALAKGTDIEYDEHTKCICNDPIKARKMAKIQKFLTFIPLTSLKRDL